MDEDDDGDGAAASYVDSQKGPVLYKLPDWRETWLGGSDAESSDDLPIESIDAESSDDRPIERASMLSVQMIGP